MRRSRFAALLAVAAGCSAPRPPRALAEHEIVPCCEKVAIHLDALRCSEARADFAIMCERLIRAGARFDVDCLAEAKSCDAVKECR